MPLVFFSKHAAWVCAYELDRNMASNRSGEDPAGLLKMSLISQDALMSLMKVSEHLLC